MSARIIRTVMLGLMAAARATPGSRLDAQQPHPPHSVSVINGRAGELIDRRFESLADSGFSGALIVARDDSILLEAGYGYANRERRVPFTAHTIAQVGSLTKQFTATAIADLMQRHKLHPSDSLGGLFANIPAQARGITLHMLLTHTSGLADDCGGDFARRSREELLSTCLAQPLLHSPGTTYAYSNFGYSVLAAVLEKVSGQSLEAYLHDRFFAPLHLDDIGYAFPGADPDTFAIGYGAAGPQQNIGERIKALGKDYWDLKGNGGMQASVDAMYRWHRALVDSPVIGPDIRGLLFQPYVLAQPGIHYGYGWFVRTDSAGAVVQTSHSGSDGVFVSLWYWRPVERVFIYSVTNCGEGPRASGVVAEVRRILGSGS